MDTRLNPYSTGSNSNDALLKWAKMRRCVLILILLEVTQICAGIGVLWALVVLILILLEVTQMQLFSHLFSALTMRLNPYSTGSNSNTLIINNLFFTLCFVYFS